MEGPVKKTCPVCGKLFEADDDELVYCSFKCFNKKRHGLSECEKLAGAKRVQDEARRAAAERRRSFLARRDAGYAKLGVPVTVEEREFGNSELGTIMRIETRGQACIGWRSCGHISHNS